MCEVEIMRMKRDMRLARRRARRLRTIHDFVARPIPLLAAADLTSSDSDASSERYSPEPLLQRLTPHESMACLRNVAARTLVLMQRNEEIQRRVMELKRETAAYLDSVMSNPENQIRFHQYHQYLVMPTPFQTPPSTEAESDASSTAGDDLRSLPDTENADANDAYDIELKAEVRCKEEPRE